MDGIYSSTPRSGHAHVVLIPELSDFRRPLWRSRVPAIWRDGATVQFGDTVIVDRLTSQHLQWLRLLDGTRTPDEACDALTFAPSEARRLVRALRTAHGIVDASITPSAVRFARPEQRETARHRWEAVVDHLGPAEPALRAMDARDRARVAIVGDGPPRDALAAALDDAGLAEVALLDKATIVILANSPHPDVPVHHEFVDVDGPHLHVAVRGHRAVAGPLVVPGQSGCLTCAHLHRRDADRLWPLVAVQWSRAPEPRVADPLLVRLAATHAVHLVRSWIDEPWRTDAWQDIAIELHLGNLVGTKVPRPPHPLCGCRWVTS